MYALNGVPSVLTDSSTRIVLTNCTCVLTSTYRRTCLQISTPIKFQREERKTGRYRIEGVTDRQTHTHSHTITLPFPPPHSRMNFYSLTHGRTTNRLSIKTSFHFRSSSFKLQARAVLEVDWKGICRTSRGEMKRDTGK